MMDDPAILIAVACISIGCISDAITSWCRHRSAASTTAAVAIADTNTRTVELRSWNRRWHGGRTPPSGPPPGIRID